MLLLSSAEPLSFCLTGQRARVSPEQDLALVRFPHVWSDFNTLLLHALLPLGFLA